jgi:hypothetical protein
MTQSPKAVPVESRVELRFGPQIQRRRERTMPRKAGSEEQIVAALHEGESGTKVAEICRRLGISQAIYFCVEEEVRRPRGQ